MKLKLTTEDRNAIDLLLDRAASAVKAPSHNYAAAAGAQHLQSVGSVLKLLQILPAAEPPADLVSRTLAHISQATGQAMAGQIMQTPAAGDRQRLRPA
jgi:hypothetical protein